MNPIGLFVAVVLVLVLVAILGSFLCPPDGPYAIFYWWICSV